MFTREKSQHYAHSFSGGFCVYHKCWPPVVCPSSQEGVGVRLYTRIFLFQLAELAVLLKSGHTFSAIWSLQVDS